MNEYLISFSLIVLGFLIFGIYLLGEWYMDYKERKENEWYIQNQHNSQ